MITPSLNELPKDHQDNYAVAVHYLNQKDTSNARKALRALIEYHTDNNFEVCEEIQRAYGKLVGLETLEESK